MRSASILIFLMLATLPLGAQGPQSMERDAWTGPISPGSTVKVHNPYGDIRLRHGGSEGNLEVAAILQQLAVDGSKLVLEVEITDDTAAVSIVRYDHLGELVAVAPKEGDARADLAVLVPEGFPTHADTTDGLIEARGVKTDIDLSTISGTVRIVKNQGRIVAHNERGHTEITLDAGATKKNQKLSSVTGPITVHTSSANALNVSMATSGAFITDFSLTVEHRDQDEPNKIARTALGAGGAVLEMESKRGDLALRRVVTPTTD